MNDSPLKYGRIILRLLWPALLVSVLVVNNLPSAKAISLSDELPRRKVIVVDPGHGGHDPGAVGPSGLAEKIVTLSVADKIKEFLFWTHEVHLTRDNDYKVDIEHRTALANHYRADVFISIHTGGGFGHQGRGTAVFYHSHGTDSMGPIPPRQRNGSWETGEKPVPWNSIQGIHTAKNKVLAKLVHKHLVGKLSPVDRGVRKAPCLVLQGADMPAILVEIGHLSHPTEEKELGRPEAISTAAQAICDAIREYFATYP